MSSVLNAIVAIAALLAAFTGPAHAVTSTVPEPSTIVLSGIGLGIAVYLLRKNRRK